MGSSSSSSSSEDEEPPVLLRFKVQQRAMMDESSSRMRSHPLLRFEVRQRAMMGESSSSSSSSSEMDDSSSSSSSSGVRFGHSLNKEEKKFVAERKKNVSHCLQKLLRDLVEDEEPNTASLGSEGGEQRAMPEVPNIALLGSGGGQRAMVGLLGSLVELDKAGLLDCILYLSGVSGSTWCMASLYQEPDWSTKLETVKDKIIKRLNGPVVSWGDAYAKLTKYWESTGRNGKDFSMTHFWAAMVITTYVKEIDEQTLPNQWDHLSKDPFPIYTVIDKDCKQQGDGDPWFEISPHEAGYSLTGAFVNTSSFGSQFDDGRKIKARPEMDMLYLQALCGSAVADGEENKKFAWKTLRDFCIGESWLATDNLDKHSQVLMDLVDMNFYVLHDKDPSALDQSIRTTLKELAGSQSQLIFPTEKLDLTNKEAAHLYMMHYNTNVLNYLSTSQDSGSSFSTDSSSETDQDSSMLISIIKCSCNWIWGRKYNFLHKMTNERVHSALLESETRDYIDAGLLNNSPYFSVLRKERDIDLIISLDFSDGDPFMTVREAAKMCKKLKIPFPEVNIPNEDVEKPKDFYVFKGQNAPTVIHTPLFNVVNCGDDIETWRKNYKTFQGPYSAEMITDLMEVAGKNISNNREKLLEEILEVIVNKLLKSFLNNMCNLL